MKKIMNETLNLSHLNEKVTLYGWVSKKRNLGGLIFIDLRDRSGIVQLMIKPENEFYTLAETLKNEYVIKVDGIVKERESKNSKLKTGDIEIDVTNLEVINTSAETPFPITDDVTALEDTRLKYRYLDLRRPILMNNFVIRHKITMAVRNFFDQNDFLEI